MEGMNDSGQRLENRRLETNLMSEGSAATHSRRERQNAVTKGISPFIVPRRASTPTPALTPPGGEGERVVLPGWHALRRHDEGCGERLGTLPAGNGDTGIFLPLPVRMICERASHRDSPHALCSCRRSGRATPETRSGLAPLELILCLPFLLAILALIINLGIEAKWKLRALSASRQVVWRQRGERLGAADPRPAGWPARRATLNVIPNPPPPLFPQDPFATHTATRGPVLRNPQVGTPESQLLVDTRMLDLSGSVEMGEARIDRGFPIFPKLRGVHLRVDHLLIDSQWRFWEMGFGSNESRRGYLLYGYTAPGSVVALSQKFQQAATAIVSAPFRRDLDVLDKDAELAAWFGPPPPDFHPQLQQTCTLNRFAVRAGPVQELIDRITGPRGGGLGGVPQAVTDRFLQMYKGQLSQLENQPMPDQAAIGRLKDLIQKLETFRGSLN